MAVEEAFDIRIEDAEAETIRTPRHIIELVMAKAASTAPPSGCLTQRAFDHLRRVLISRAGVPRKRIIPTLHLSDLIPRPSRRALLQEISTELSIRSPVVLERPAVLTGLLISVCIGAGIGAASFLPGAISVNSILAGLGAAALTGAAAYRMTQNFCTEFPKEICTVGDLSRWVMVMKPNLALPQRTAWTREQVAARVKDIVVLHLGSESTYHEDALFVEDLGLS